jgi:hypothetical protein
MKMKSPGSVPGLSLPHSWVCSLVARDHRAAEVEAPHDLAAHGVNVFLRLNELTRDRSASEGHLKTLIAVVGKAILGLPEQARQEAETVLVPVPMNQPS